MALEFQVSCDVPSDESSVERAVASHSLRREFAVSAGVVAAVVEATMPKLDTGGSTKIVVVLQQAVRPPFQRVRPSAPNGRDGDNVDLVYRDFDVSVFERADREARRLVVLEELRAGIAELAAVRGWQVDGLLCGCDDLRRDGVPSYEWA
jgi:hypothetical protein